MSRLEFSVAAQGQWSRRIEQEMYARLNWRHKYGHLAKEDTRGKVMAEGRGPLPENQTAARIQESKKKQKQIQDEIATLDKAIGDLGSGKTEPNIFPTYEARVVLPVDPCIQQYLRENYGRELYLKLRKSLDPDEKHQFEKTESQVYGWMIRLSKACFISSNLYTLVQKKYPVKRLQCLCTDG